MPNKKKGRAAAIKRATAGKGKKKGGRKGGAASAAASAAAAERKEADEETAARRTAELGRQALMEKYEVRLGPKGYIPSAGPKSFSIHEFSMMDPGGGRVLLDKTELKVSEGRRYGLVGKNGFGKTTLLKQMVNYEIEGYPRNVRMVLVHQEEIITEQTVLECVLNADEVRTQLITEEERITRILTATPEDDAATQDELNALLEIIWDAKEDVSLDSSEKRAMQLLRGLGFSNEMARGPVNDLSGGWQMRVKLCQALFVEPDLALLDEPTNHLDFPTVLWLEKYLVDYPKTVIVVSHDRAFLNAVCTDTIHLTQTKLLYFKGAYDTMVKTSSIALVEQVQRFEALEKEITTIKEWIRKYKDKGEKMASAVQSKRKQLEKMESEAELIRPARATKELMFSFPDIGGIEDYVARFTDVSFKYPTMDTMLLEHLDFQLDMDSRIAMIGANGVGKSTIVKLIMDKLQPTTGDVLRNRQCRISLFTQYHIDQLDLEQSAVQFICEKFASDAEMVKQKDKIGYARRRLGRFQLTGKQHTQQMKFLSGGQKSRVAFCIATWSMPHFLIFDEPTNHLDMESIESLTTAISDFHGGVLLISHDEYFLRSAANEYWAVTPEAIRVFEEFEQAKKFALGERIKEIEEKSDDGD